MDPLKSNVPTLEEYQSRRQRANVKYLKMTQTSSQKSRGKKEKEGQEKGQIRLIY